MILIIISFILFQFRDLNSDDFVSQVYIFNDEFNLDENQIYLDSSSSIPHENINDQKANWSKVFTMNTRFFIVTKETKNEVRILLKVLFNSFSILIKSLFTSTIREILSGSFKEMKVKSRIEIISKKVFNVRMENLVFIIVIARLLTHILIEMNNTQLLILLNIFRNMSKDKKLSQNLLLSNHCFIRNSLL